mmetsp:Transcript_7460/g.10870  ORF Transcript_7460/g.10870 Transcript_7460/m.10870 type:complete len:132 (+) Transcript_7460:68-463(+)
MNVSGNIPLIFRIILIILIVDLTTSRIRVSETSNPDTSSTPDLEVDITGGWDYNKEDRKLWNRNKHHRRKKKKRKSCWGWCGNHFSSWSSSDPGPDFYVHEDATTPTSNNLWWEPGDWPSKQKKWYDPWGW